MKISAKEWKNYINRLSSINYKAVTKMQKWMDRNGVDDIDKLIDYAMALSERYGEAAATLVCKMYDEIADAQKANVLPAVPAEKIARWEMFKNVSGAQMQGKLGDIPKIVGRSVKQAGADTMLKNAKRDGAYFAWINHGDSCAYCFMIAAGGWRRASSETIRGDHAEHIHNHCRCEFVIDLNGNLTIEGYDPNKLKERWKAITGATVEEKLRNLQKHLDNVSQVESFESAKGHSVKKWFTRKLNAGYGDVTFDERCDEEDIQKAEWLKRLFGGDLHCLKDNPQIGKMPDALWEDVYVEFKTPKSAKRLDDRIRAGCDQLSEALTRDGKPADPRILVVDISKLPTSGDNYVSEIEQLAKSRAKGPTMMIIKKDEELIKTFDV